MSATRTQPGGPCRRQKMHYCRPSASTAPLLHPPPAVGWVIITIITARVYHQQISKCSPGCMYAQLQVCEHLRHGPPACFMFLGGENPHKNNYTCVQRVGCNRVFNRQVEPRLRNCAQTDRLEGWNGGINCNMSHMTALHSRPVMPPHHISQVPNHRYTLHTLAKATLQCQAGWCSHRWSRRCIVVCTLQCKPRSETDARGNERGIKERVQGRAKGANVWGWLVWCARRTSIVYRDEATHQSCETQPTAPRPPPCASSAKCV